MSIKFISEAGAINIIYVIGIIFYVVGNYFHELSLQKLTETVKGTIISTSTQNFKNRQCITAEYAINGKTYKTRIMKIPKKRVDKFLTEGDVVDVMYSKEKPSKSIISGDVYMFVNAKKGLFCLIPFIIIVIALCTL